MMIMTTWQGVITIIMAMLVTLATVFAFGSTTSAAFAASSSYAD